MSMFVRALHEVEMLQDAVFMCMHTLNFRPNPRRATFFGKWAGVLLLVIDLGMVAHAVINDGVGWSDDVANISRHFNIIELVFGSWFGGISLQGLSLVFHLLVFTLFGLFGLGVVTCHEFGKEISCPSFVWSAIRTLSAFLVVAVFPVTLRALLLPLQCGFWDGVFSTTTPCSLGEFPQILITIVCLIIATFFVAFSLVTTTLGASITPLSPRALAYFRGRSEAMFFCTKTMVVAAPILFPSMTVSTFSLIVTIFMIAVLAHAIYEMPYFKRLVNYIRIFSFGVVLWLLFSTTLAAHMREADPTDDAGNARVHDMLSVLLIPVGIVLGTISVIIAKYRIVMLQRRASSLLHRLREAQMAPPAPTSQLDSGPASATWGLQDGGESGRHRRTLNGPMNGGDVENGDSPHARPQVSHHNAAKAQRQRRHAASGAYAKRGENSEVDDFFCQERVVSTFWTGMDAVIACKLMLEGCRKEDIDAIEQVIMASVSEMPTHAGLEWAVNFLLFVRRDTQAAALMLDETGGEADESAPLDMTYALFASRAEVARVMKQNSLSSIELRKEQEEATRLFLDAVKCLRRFWSAIGDKTEPHILQGLMSAFIVAVHKADELFDSLEMRMPDHPTLMRNHAEFLECVLNQLATAHDLRQKAMLLEENTQGNMNDGASSHASSTGARALHRQEWTQRILEEEQYNLKHVFSDVLRILICLVAVATVGLIVVDTILFSGSAEQSIQHIVDVSIIRYQVVRLCYYVRDLVWAANIHETSTDPVLIAAAAAKFASTQAKIVYEAGFVAGNTTREYETASGDVSKYYAATMVLVKFPESTTTWGLSGLSYYDTVSQLARRVVSIGEESKAVLATPQSRALSNTSPIWDLQFVMRNALSSILDAIEGSMLVLEGEVGSFVLRAQLSVAVNALLNGVLAIWIVLIVMRSLSDSSLFCRSITIVTGVAMHLSKTSRRKLITHYKNVEVRLVQRGEEQNAEGFDEAKSLSDMGSRHGSMMSGSSLRSSVRSGMSGLTGSSRHSGKRGVGNKANMSRMAVKSIAQDARMQQHLIEKTELTASLLKENMLKGHLEKTLANPSTVDPMSRFLHDASGMTRNTSDDASKQSPVSAHKPRVDPLVDDATPLSAKLSVDSAGVSLWNGPTDSGAKGAKLGVGADDLVAVSSETDKVAQEPVKVAQEPVNKRGRRVVRPMLDELGDASNTSPQASTSPKSIMHTSPKSIMQTSPKSALKKSGLQAFHVAGSKLSLNAETPTVNPTGRGKHWGPALDELLLEGEEETENETVEKKKPVKDDEDEEEVDETTNKWAARLTHHNPEGKVIQSAAAAKANAQLAEDNAEMSPKSPSARVKGKGVMFGAGTDLVETISTSVIDKRLKENITAAEHDETTEAKKHRLAVTRRFRLQIAFIVCAFVAYGIVVYQVIGDVKIGSQLFTDIVEMKDLIADLLPPPGYIIESFLMTLRLLGQTGTASRSDIDEAIDELWFHEQMYFERNRVWKDSLEPGDLRDLMTGAARGSAVEFYESARKFFLPAVRAGDRRAATAAALVLEGHFLAHKAAIVETVDGAVKQFLAVEKQGNQSTVYFENVVVGVGAAFASIFVLFGILFTAPFASGLKKRLLLFNNKVHPSGGGQKVGKSGVEASMAGALFVVFVIMMGAYCAAMYFAATECVVSGDKFNAMMLMKDLIADILPPPAYLIESYLNTLRVSLKSKRPGGLAQEEWDEHMADGVRLHDEYTTRQNYWVTGLTPSILKSSVTIDAFEPGSDYMAIYDRDFVPLVTDQNYTLVEDLVYGDLLETFLAHRAKVVYAVELSIQKARILQTKAGYGVPMAYIILFGVGGALVFVGAFAMWMLWYEGDKTESMRTAQMARDTTSGLYELLPALKAMLLRTGSFWMRRQTSWAIYACLLALSFSYVLLPMRHLAQIQNIASLSNQAGRSVMLASKCTHIARELLVRDALMSMSETSLRFALEQCLADMRNVQKAIRAGGEFGIREGTDTNSKETDELMFNMGCLRGNTDCFNENPIFKHAASSGLNFMEMFTADLLEKILLIANPPAGYALFPSLDGKVEPSPELAYLLRNFDGELFYGLTRASSLLKEQFIDLFQSIHFEQRVLYGTYVSFAICVFFLGTFRYTVHTLTQELEEAKEFVGMIPLQVLPGTVEVGIRRLFLDVEDE